MSNFEVFMTIGHCVFLQQSCPWSSYLRGVHTGNVRTVCRVQWWTHLLSLLLLVCENWTKLSHRWHFLEMKYLSNIDFTVSYVIVSSSVNVNDFRISSASSPVQYISIFTSALSPCLFSCDAILNQSNLIQRGQPAYRTRTALVE